MTIKTMIFTHRPRALLTWFTFCRWRHNRLLVTAQWPDNCDTVTWIVISNSLTRWLAGKIYLSLIPNLNLVITVFADGLAPTRHRTDNQDCFMCFFGYRCIWFFLPDTDIQHGRRDRAKSRSTIAPDLWQQLSPNMTHQSNVCKERYI